MQNSRVKWLIWRVNFQNWRVKLQNGVRKQLKYEENGLIPGLTKKIDGKPAQFRVKRAIFMKIRFHLDAKNKFASKSANLASRRAEFASKVAKLASKLSKLASKVAKLASKAPKWCKKAVMIRRKWAESRFNARN
ncbi:hypothetical protein [Peribacillus muralis]|uniref:hypothetical protein n=1 Tax=Peribacillus muralis TaxID=264697 RepID=UPI003D093F27